jgi:hypothetical protein
LNLWARDTLTTWLQQKERVMPRTSSSKTPSKRKRASPRTPAVAAKKTTAVRHKALRAAKADPVLTQELREAPVRTAVPAVQTLPFLPAVELLGLMSRAASTSLALPFAMMRCRTPFEMWGAQSKFLQSVFADFQTVSARAMNNAFNGVAEEARDRKVKKRR